MNLSAPFVRRPVATTLLTIRAALVGSGCEAECGVVVIAMPGVTGEGVLSISALTAAAATTGVVTG